MTETFKLSFSRTFNSFPSIQFLICVSPNFVRCSRWELIQHIIFDFVCQAFFKTFLKFFENLFANSIASDLVWMSLTRQPNYYIIFKSICQEFFKTFLSFFELFWRILLPWYRIGLLSCDSLTIISYMLLNVNCFFKLFPIFLTFFSAAFLPLHILRFYKS